MTGDAAVQAARGAENGRVAAFVSAPGSAGTLAAGDHIKSLWPESKIVALEPRECSTLFNGGRGQHRIEGIGDKMVTLIHNVYNTDLLMLVHDLMLAHDEETVRGIAVIQAGGEILVERLGVLRTGSPHRLADRATARRATANLAKLHHSLYTSASPVDLQPAEMYRDLQRLFSPDRIRPKFRPGRPAH